MRSLGVFAVLVLALLAGCGVTTEIVGRTPPPEAEIVRIELTYANAYLIRSARPILIDSGSPGELSDHLPEARDVRLELLPEPVEAVAG